MFCIPINKKSFNFKLEYILFIFLNNYICKPLLKNTQNKFSFYKIIFCSNIVHWQILFPRFKTKHDMYNLFWCR